MRQTIKKHSDFLMADTDPVARSNLFIIRMRKTKFEGDARYGLVATKKTMKLATDRNRAKRRLRVWLRANEPLLRDDMDYVFIARRAILDSDRDLGIAEIKKALKHINKQDA